MNNFYDVLGIAKTATERDIRQAYRRLARQHHPDVNQGDPAAEEKFKEINEAHSVLSDPEKRQKYDRYGDQWANADRIEDAATRSHSRGGGDFHWSTFDGFDPRGTTEEPSSSVFDQLFRDLGQKVRPNPSPKPEYPVEVTLEEAQKGANRLVHLPEGRRLEVRIPPGVDNGSRIHIPAGGKDKGEFYLVVTVEEHERFLRQGHNLYCEMEVPLEDVVLGGEITVPTLSGRVALTIPAETQNGQRFRLNGQGMPTLNQPGQRGDLFTTVKVSMPTGLTDLERDLFRQIKESRASGSR